MKKYLLLLILVLLATEKPFAQDKSYRPGLFFREDWKETPAEIPLSQKHVSNPELLVHLYGPGQDSLKKSNHKKPVDDPFYVWSGLCLSNWLVTLEHRSNNVNLSNYSKIIWRTKQAGLRHLRIVLKLANGQWLISAQSDGSSKNWRIKEFNIADINWHKLDIDRIVETGPLPDVDLLNVQEIGFTDLMPGGKSAACSRLDWIEVYGQKIPK
ncbi:MAG: hypothetical protein CR996_01005 [Draconibacterium sp.]|nr:MAG: hypothetical protein CR996_01005 [Draconibacterium sp.]PIF06549.1 MAG: hypothetical protein CSA36_00890 [Draconibacterium sp.]